jgi:hypothetical protein
MAGSSAPVMYYHTWPTGNNTLFIFDRYMGRWMTDMEEARAKKINPFSTLLFMLKTASKHILVVFSVAIA